MNIINNQNFNGIFYKIMDNENNTRGYLLGLIHKAIEGITIQPKDFSEDVKKRFKKTISLIVEVSLLPESFKNALEILRKTHFCMDYELMIEASKEKKEIKELETYDFQLPLLTKSTADHQQQMDKLIAEISTQVMASEKYEKTQLHNEKLEQLEEYEKKKKQTLKELYTLIFTDSEEKLIEEKRKQKKEDKNKIKKLTEEIISLKKDEELIRYINKIQNIFNERTKEHTELTKRAYEISNESEFETFIKFGTSSEMFKALWDDRNVAMTYKINDILLKEPGRHFIGVGKGHLVGQMGIVSLLREKGWKLERFKRDSLVF